MTNTIKHIVLTITVLTVTLCYGQDKPLITKEIINEIAKNNYVAPYPDGFINYETPQYKLYIQLQKTATTEELLKYTDDKRPVVRIYAIKCLDDQEFDNFFPLAIKHIHDTIKVRESGHRSRDVYVGDFFVGIQNIRIYDIAGREVLKPHFHINENSLKLDVTALAPGTYTIVYVEKSRGIQTSLFVKE